MAEKLLTISKFAQLFNTTQHTIRHYEQQGLLQPATIAANGYRQYGMAEAYQLSFILFLRQLGLSLAEIKAILTSDYSEQTLLLNKKQALQEEIARLQALEQTIDDQLQQVNQQDTLQVDQPIHLRVLQRLPFAQDFDLSVVETIDWQPDWMLRQLYYVINETDYAICMATPAVSDYQIDAGCYVTTTIEAASGAEFDSALAAITTHQTLPLIGIEMRGTFLSPGKHLAVKILGNRKE
ncbi:hypothetical protein BCY75_06880 [Latilactobacillus curvatus]|uniref:MerR family transcriptional regulator n=1 Tax=Latilactobacillus TaxID=2767885 RepID=UPI0008150741|nr:MerR family transcriptional regulator [Latilactobacillus curvatus]MDT3393907.1 MerR family transcriptional regulator [Bacillota bacterium]ANY13720.1 hypothetical protein BCY75_06880 [Latilactobacillus curvatus]MCM0724849.1 MerR family transcriptional regulator [Latilactobacillus curvatus]MCS8616925.1 MerR family transcriptional regulator [Latilactobacillus curvatus]QAR35446.1 MerR family transcriptional regulator [Latilactobacillus curvatus]